MDLGTTFCWTVVGTKVLFMSIIVVDGNTGYDFFFERLYGHVYLLRCLCFSIDSRVDITRYLH
jgi:hypothetical protein